MGMKKRCFAHCSPCLLRSSKHCPCAALPAQVLWVCSQHPLASVRSCRRQHPLVSILLTKCKVTANS